VLAAEALLDALPGVLDGTSAPVPQDDSRATLAPKIAKSEAALDWRAAALALERQVRAFDPWPVAEAHLTDGRRLRVFAAEAMAGPAAGAPGAIVAAGREGIDVATGDGVLRLLKVQAPSGRVMDAEAYLAAHSLAGVQFVV
jgi:methionyl-tRNA formyltransferase